MNYYNVVQKNFLTVWILILLTMALVLILTLTGCEKQTQVISVEEATAEEAAAAEETPQETPSSNETEEEPAEPQSDLTSKKDLRVKSIILSTIYPNPGESFEATITVENTGTEDITSFEYLINVYKGAVLEKSTRQDYAAKLGAGSAAKIRQDYFFPDMGDYVLEVKLDPSNNIKEKDESDNMKTADFSVIAQTSSSSGSDADEGPSPAPSGSCSDTDGGKAYSTKGKCTDQVMYIAGFSDFCLSSTKLVEMYCKEGECVQEEHMCSCVEGACS